MKKCPAQYLVGLSIVFCSLLTTALFAGGTQVPSSVADRSLDGPWEFVWQQMITGKNDIHVDWQEVNIPGSWNLYPEYLKDRGPYGYGTFKKVIVLESSRSGLRFPDVLSAHRVYIDTVLLYSAGQPATTPEEEAFGNFNRLYRLPDRYENGDTVTIYVQTSNFHYRLGGIMRSPMLGEYDSMHQRKALNAFWQAFQMGAVGIMALFILIYATVRTGEKYIYILFLLCAGIFLYNSLNGEYLLLTLFPKMSGGLIMKLAYLSFYLGVTLHFLLVAELFREEFPRWMGWVVMGLGIIASLTVILLPMAIYSYTMPAFQLLTIIMCLYLIWKIYRLSLQNKPGARILAAGISIIFVFLVLELLYVHKFIHIPSIFGWGVLLYLLMLVIVASRRFYTAVTNEERLWQELRTANEQLEFKVTERTRDIEAKKLIIEQQQHDIVSKNQELVRTREEEKNMLKVIIHDLKAPFNKIAGLINISRMTSQGKGHTSELDMSKLNEMIAAVADEGKSLIEDLNTLTFFESYLEDTTGYKDMDMIPFLAQLVKSHQSYAENKEITLQLDHDTDSYTCATHPHALTRIIDNLLSNAIKFSPSQKNIEITLATSEDSYAITIRDEGPGFTREDKQKIYHKFQRLSAKPTKGESSTGLGLNIVKSLTDGLGGKIQLISGENEGAAFRLTFDRYIRHST